MNTIEFSRYLIDSLDRDVITFQRLSQEQCVNEQIQRGVVAARCSTLGTAVDWRRFPTSLQIEARKAVRRARTALNG